MKNLVLFLTAWMILSSCQQSMESGGSHDHTLAKNDTAGACCSVKDGLFLHVSSGYENPHKVLMALKMAKMMSEDKDVALYLDISAVELVLKSSKDMTYSDFPPLKELLKHLIDRKVTIMACPTCLKVAGYQPEDLMDGVIVAQKDKFFNFTKGRIVTLDY